MKIVVILSGGLDSTTLLYHLKATGHSLHALTFNYGQRHHRELQCAAAVCQQTGTSHETIDLQGLATVFGRNALTDVSIVVPQGAYAEENLAITTVPNRNMILLSIAIGRALSLHYDAVAFGAHQGLAGRMYADCSPEFAASMNEAGRQCDVHPVQVLAPFVTWQKADIVRRAAELHVPFELTWSCYQGAESPCGECGTCHDRADAFRSVGLVDPLTV